MTSEICNALFRYFEALYDLNRDLIMLCGADVLDNSGQYDKCVERVVTAIEKVNGVLLITADHGNSEQMIDYATGEPHTAHTTNPVPLILVGKDAKLKEGRLADLAPTMLDILGIEKPEEMTGESLIEK